MELLVGLGLAVLVSVLVRVPFLTICPYRVSILCTLACTPLLLLLLLLLLVLVLVAGVVGVVETFRVLRRVMVVLIRALFLPICPWRVCILCILACTPLLLLLLLLAVYPLCIRVRAGYTGIVMLVLVVAALRLRKRGRLYM
jgi:hypothetical protein